MCSKSLKEKIKKYVETGAHFRHLPQYAENAVFSLNLENKHNKQSLKKSILVGGLVDGTSGTLKDPDEDIAMQWTLGESIMQKLAVVTIDEGESGLCYLQVKKGEEYHFKPLFIPFALDIINDPIMGNDKKIEGYNLANVFIEMEGTVFINGHLMRGSGRAADVHSNMSSYMPTDLSNTGVVSEGGTFLEQGIMGIIVLSPQQLHNSCAKVARQGFLFSYLI